MTPKHFSQRLLLSLAFTLCLSGGLFLAVWLVTPLRAQTTFPAQGEVKRDANLRGGPGTTYPIQGTATAGSIITATAVDATGKWYRMDTVEEQWIAVALVLLQTPAGTALPPAAAPLTTTGALTPTEPLTATPAVTTTAPLSATGDASTDAGTTVALTATNQLSPTNAVTATTAVSDTSPFAGSGTQPVAATVLKVANLRSGPGITYEIAGKAQPGDVLSIVAATPAQDWVQLADGRWIAAFLVQLKSSAAAATQSSSTLLPLVSTDTSTEAVADAVAPKFRVTVAIPPGSQAATVVEVLSGDTIRVRIGAVTDFVQFTETVRYLAIDAPDAGETGQATATAANAALAANQPVFLVRETSDRNLQGQLLRHVYTGDGVFVNASLVASGYALPLAAAPDNQQAATFDLYAAEAAKAARGFWEATAGATNTPGYALAVGPAVLYSGPGSTNQAVTTLAQDMALLIFGRTLDGGWVQVRTPRGEVGWVYVPQVAYRGSISALPVVATGPPGPAPAPIPGQADPNAAPGATPGAATMPGVPTPVPTPTPFYAAPTVVILTPQFTGPGPTFPTVGELQPGTTVGIYGSNPELTWYVLTSGYWVPAVTIAGAPPNLPVVATPEAPPPAITPPPTPVLVPPPGTTFTPTPIPLPTDTPMPPATPTPAALPQIIEVNKAEEWVLLYNQGTGFQDLAGWSLYSENGGERCALSGSLQPAGTLRVWTGTGPDGFSCNLPMEIWNNDAPDAAVLFNAQGVPVSRFPP